MTVLMFLVIHIVVCLLIGILLRNGIIKTRTQIYPTVVLVPVCGVLILIAEQLVNLRNKSGSREIGLEKLRIQEAKFKRIEVEQDEEEDMIVPLEEAIVVNDSKTRRKLMLDILHRNPEEHISLLQKARLADDTELTHYATTSMMEIQSSYEQNIRDLERDLKENPEREEIPGILRKLRKELELYIESGLITGNILSIYQKKLGTVLNQLLEIEPQNKKYYLRRVENRIEQTELDKVPEELEEASSRWSEDEAVYRLWVKYYHAIGQGEKIQEVLTEIEEKKIYLSGEGKKWFAFWKK